LSATDDVFNICVSAVQKDHQKVANYLQKVGQGGGISAEEYRTLPVFLGLRNIKVIADAFCDVFREELVPPKLS
jgi:hypothetical protein